MHLYRRFFVFKAYYPSTNDLN